MNRRTFTLAGFFGAIGAAVGKVLGREAYPSTPLPIEAEPKFNPWGQLSDHSIKVGRKIMRLNPEDVWEVYADTAQTAASMSEGIAVKNSIDLERWLAWNETAETNNAPSLLPPRLREHLTLAPEDIKHWSAAPNVEKPVHSAPVYIDITEAHTMLEALEGLIHSPPWAKTAEEMRGEIFSLANQLRKAIERKGLHCSGHNGPALGLTAHDPMREMPDGRRLCPYCYKQETERDVQHDGSNRGQTPSA